MKSENFNSDLNSLKWGSCVNFLESNMKRLFFIFIIIYPFLVFSEFDDSLYPDDQPSGKDNDTNNTIVSDLSGQDLKSLVDGCSSFRDDYFKEMGRRCENGKIDFCKSVLSISDRFCNEGDASACEVSHLAFENGITVKGKAMIKKDFRKAVDYAKKACSLDNELCGMFGSRYVLSFGGYHSDSDAGKFLLGKGCSSGDASSCFVLGGAYKDGVVLKKDNALAFKYYFKACELSFGISGSYFLMCAPADWYESGKGVPRNYSYALKFYEILCKNGVANYCVSCSIFYNEGKGTIKDLKKSFSYTEKACELGNGVGCFNLGLSFYRGLGVKKDIMRAVVAYRKGCELKNPMSCSNLGVLYRDGNGVPKSIKLAEEFFYKASLYSKESCSSGNKEGCDIYKNLYDVGFGIEEED